MHKIPVAGLVLLLGVDRFLNEARALTKLIGNGVATIAVAKWEGAIDMAQARAVPDGEVTAPSPVAPIDGELHAAWRHR